MVSSTVLLTIVFATMDIVCGDISFEGSKSEDFVRLNCSFGDKPIATTVEFLVDGSTAYNIRLYNDQCYRTVSGIPCTPEECQCSSDGRHYFWVYQYKFNRFRTECKAKTNENCFASATILFTEKDPHAVALNHEDCDTSNGHKDMASKPVMAISVFLFCMIRNKSLLSCLVVVCLLVISSSYTGSCVNMMVSLTYKDVNGTLCMYCDVKHLHFAVELIDPRGLSYHCTAAIALLAPGDCDQSLPGSPPFKMQQDIHKNRTILTLYNDQLECENGIWQCKHGTNTGEESNVTVSVSRLWDTKPTVKHLDKGVNQRPILFVLIHCGVFVGISAITFCFIKFLRYGTSLMRNLRTCIFSNERSLCDTVASKVTIIALVGVVLYFILLIILMDVYQDYLGVIASAAFAVIYVVILFWLFNKQKKCLSRPDDIHANLSPHTYNTEEAEETY